MGDTFGGAHHMVEHSEVAPHPGGIGHAPAVHQPMPVQVVAGIEGHHGHTLLGEQLHCPRADTPVGPGDEEPLIAHAGDATPGSGRVSGHRWEVGNTPEGGPIEAHDRQQCRCMGARTGSRLDGEASARQFE